jgi:hypothetical protein
LILDRSTIAPGIAERRRSRVETVIDSHAVDEPEHVVGPRAEHRDVGVIEWPTGNMKSPGVLA